MATAGHQYQLPPCSLCAHHMYMDIYTNMYTYISMYICTAAAPSAPAFRAPRLHLSLFAGVALAQNGSSIRPWWIHHHYISAAVAVVMIMWPITPTYRQFTPLFNVRG
jgi:hypothetical protein